MSTASKVTLLGTIIGTAGIVTFVHWAQTAEKAVGNPPASTYILQHG
jgi:PET assembly of cytochrome c oxidase, mitochondrial